MEDYKKKYEEAVKQMVADGQISQEVAEKYFPELKENEDERMLNNLHSWMKEFDGAEEYTEKVYQWIKGLLKKEDKKALYILGEDGEYHRVPSRKPTGVLAKILEEMQEKEAKSNVNVGDWVVNNNGEPRCYQVFGRSWPNSIIRDNTHDRTFFLNTATLDKQFHLWTIQDAKDGDVLARNNDILSICVFSHFDDINNKFSSFLCRCGLEGEGLGQVLSINGYHDDSKNYFPATKEQCDLLFQKIKEAGYEWDAEKKELKKIEQKPTWSEADEIEVATLKAYICSRDWSDRHIDRALGIVDELVNKIKSLKERYTWNPSDEQMEALKHYVDTTMDGEIDLLYQDLKKLREE